MVASKRIIPVSEDLLGWIDEHRGDLERDEFVGLCIDLALDKQEAEESEVDDEVVCVIPGSASYHGASGALAGVLPSRRQAPLPNFAPVMAATAGTADGEYEYYYEEEEEEKSAFGKDILPLSWWVPALLLFGFGDTLTSALVFSKGGVEVNPFMRFALSLPGGLWSFVMLKTVAMAGLMVIAVWTNIAILRWLIPLATSLVGLYLVWNNVRVFLSI